MLTVLASSSRIPCFYGHPFFVSVTEIRSDTQKKTFTVSARMFTEDLQSAIFKQYNYKGALDDEDGSANDVLTQYLAAHLSVKSNGKPVEFQWVGYETEEEATWCHIEAKTFPETGKIEVSNRLLYDFIDAQTNLIHCYRDGVRSSYKLVYPDTDVAFE